jgi:hypothetical protein
MMCISYEANAHNRVPKILAKYTVTNYRVAFPKISKSSTDVDYCDK